MSSAPEPAAGPGSSRATGLGPNLPFRLVVSGIWTVFALLLLGVDPFSSRGVVRDVPFLLATYVLLRVWTTRVWVEPAAGPDPARLVHRRLGRSHSAPLHPPNSLRVRAPAPFGPRPEWSIRVLTPDGLGVKVATPWMTDLPALRARLRPIVAEHPTLATGERARAFFAPPRGRPD